ncbi:T9SS type A sorting domain-containing protein [Flavobacterium sp. SUN052]|uniref:T9SS type A sorting domain-containing protein n=1 Tax=Flavobacterium sp. SUN052 TaxID=3002441 RepID=UPI00237E5324|nr:T9SS type A sorting domain-containing protein [Flavobacterium sp. SUN052]MEC4005315.1 T9SS type A sorting domain-containing protein [Flavobacterium sp. SUN052]
MKKYLFLIFISTIASAQFSWSPLSNIASNSNGQRFDDVFFLNENLGWAANGYYAAVYKTTDGGATWVQQLNNSILGSSHYFRNIEFLDENIGFLGTLNGKFYKTIDGGSTWNLVMMSPNPAAICGLDCVGTSTVYGCGAYFSPAYIIKSSDSGVTWQYIDMSTYATALVEVLFTDENTGFASGTNSNGAVLLKTIDGGITWTTVYNGSIAGEYVWKLQILASNSNIIFGAIEAVAPNNGKLLKSIDAGVTWITKNAPEPEIQAVGFVDENHGWMGGHATGFYETLDGGDTWSNTSVGSNLNRIFFINNNLAYACGTTIYKMTNNLNVASFQEQARIPLAVRVAPNPINDKLNLEIDFTGVDHLVLGLYNSNGQFIKQLKLDEIYSAGTQKYAFDFPYPNGVYFVNLHTNTGRQSFKIMK